MTATLCPCQSGRVYTECCAPFHAREAAASTAEELMRSRYRLRMFCRKYDYIVDTPVPAQQNLLDKQDLAAWSQQTQWSGLKVIRHVPFGKLHALVELRRILKRTGKLSAIMNCRRS